MRLIADLYPRANGRFALVVQSYSTSSAEPAPVHIVRTFATPAAAFERFQAIVADILGPAAQRRLAHSAAAHKAWRTMRSRARTIARRHGLHAQTKLSKSTR